MSHYRHIPCEQPAARQVLCPPVMITAASPAPPWIGPLCSSSSPSRRADIVVVDKINRLTRSLADFA
jgi:hypothetical protein